MPIFDARFDFRVGSGKVVEFDWSFIRSYGQKPQRGTTRQKTHVTRI